MALTILPFLLADSRSKPDHHKLLVPCQVCYCLYNNRVSATNNLLTSQTCFCKINVELPHLYNHAELLEDIKKRKKSPYVVLTGEDQEVQAFLIVDKTLICECTPIQSIPLYLMSSFFSFHIQYTPGCHNVYSFLEHALLGYKETTTFCESLHCFTSESGLPSYFCLCNM